MKDSLLEKDVLLKKVRDDVVVCKKCDLWKTRNLPMIWKWNHDARLFFVWEAPWSNENKTWHPFVWVSWKILDEFLEKLWLIREDIYITNVLKCHPPFNTNPKREQIDECIQYLKRQIKIIRPKVICTLWKFASLELCKMFWVSLENTSLSYLNGKILDTGFWIAIVPCFHPSAMLYDPSKKEAFFHTALVIHDLLKKTW